MKRPFRSARILCALPACLALSGLLACGPVEPEELEALEAELQASAAMLEPAGASASEDPGAPPPPDAALVTSPWAAASQPFDAAAALQLQAHDRTGATDPDGDPARERGRPR
jgi:hypothetical protein